MYVAQIAYLLELFDLDGDAIGQFLTQLAKHLLAQKLGGEKAFAAVRDVVGSEYRRRFGQVLLGRLDQRIESLPAFCA